MKIIKHGSPPKPIMCFRCDYCGCIFELDRSLDEQPVFSNPQPDLAKDYVPLPYYTTCPDCGFDAEGDYIKIM